MPVFDVVVCGLSGALMAEHLGAAELGMSWHDEVNKSPCPGEVRTTGGMNDSTG